MVHRDQTHNVIMDPRGEGRLTLVDLGLVRIFPERQGVIQPIRWRCEALRAIWRRNRYQNGYSLVRAFNTGDKQLVDTRVDMYALG